MSDVELKFSVPAIVKVPLAPSKIPLVLNGEKLVLDFKIIRGKRQKKIVKPAKKKQKKGGMFNVFLSITLSIILNFIFEWFR